MPPALGWHQSWCTGVQVKEAQRLGRTCHCCLQSPYCLHMRPLHSTQPQGCTQPGFQKMLPLHNMHQTKLSQTSDNLHRNEHSAAVQACVLAWQAQFQGTLHSPSGKNCSAQRARSSTSDSLVLKSAALLDCRPKFALLPETSLPAHTKGGF